MKLFKNDESIINAAMKILESRCVYRVDSIKNPNDARRLAQLKLSGLEHEVFAIMFLDNKNKVIAFENIFRGTINIANVHQREVVKECLKHNASAVILVHNHTSGDSHPSTCDQQLTQSLKTTLKVLDITILDHLIVGEKVYSFAEAGIL